MQYSSRDATHSHSAPAERVAWKLNAERLVILGWGRAVLMQLAHPLVAAGVAEHSQFRASPLDRMRRFRRTLDAMLTFTYGSTEDAQRVANHINGIHDRVSGSLDTTTGALQKGAVYSAHDPELLRWVQATLLDSTLQTYERFVGPLSADLQDRYCTEARSIGPLLGIPDELMPQTRAELSAYIEEMLGTETIAVGPTAQGLAANLLGLSHGVAGVLELPVMFSYRLATAGLLPASLRTAYRLRWSAAHQAMFEAGSRASRMIHPMVPSVISQWSAARRHRRERTETLRRAS
ncbi:MAG: oxygenase MpaB family protein [Chloroflexota bacterium]